MIRLTTLGATDVRDRLGRPVREILAQPKRFALLVHLAVEGRRGAISRDRLLAMFWPESDTERARNSLSQALHHLRQALGSGVVESQGTHALGVGDDRLWCDASVFAEALERGDAALALDLYRGDFCPALFVAGAPEVEDWLDRTRRQIRTQALAAARTQAERLADQGDRDGAGRAARRALALRPDDEADVRALLSLLERVGDSAGALFAFQDFAKRLNTELETEPEPATRLLADAIRRRREAPIQVSAAAGPPERKGSAERADTEGDGRRELSLGSLRPRHLVLAALGVAGIIIGTFSFRARLPATPAPVRAVAVFPFSVRGGGLAYLREGMVDLVSAKLAGVVGIRALDPRAVIAASPDSTSPDPQANLRIARRLGASWYITGDVVEVAGQLQVNGTLFDAAASDRPLATASVAGDSSALFQLVDELSGRMLAGLVGGRDTALTRLAAVTTSSLPALKAYLAGEQALRAGRDAQAGAAFHEAALLDTTFALAQYRLALTSNWVTIPGVNPLEWARIAARHSQRLTPLVRDLLSAYVTYKDVRWAEAEQRYRALTAAYPEHVEAWLMLGETYFHYNWLHGEPPTDAWTPLERVLTLDPGNVHALIHLARLAALEGRTALLDSLVGRYVGRHSEAERSLEMRALRAYAHDDPAERAAIARDLRNADDLVSYSILEAATVYDQNMDAAVELAPRFDPSRIGNEAWPSVLAQGRRALVSIGPTTGRWDRAVLPWAAVPADARDWEFETRILMAAEPAIPLPRARIAALRDSLRVRRPYPVLKALTYPGPSLISGADMQSYLDGLLSMRLGDRRDVERIAAELAAGGTDSVAKARAMLGHALRAEIAHAAGNDRTALAELDKFELGPPLWVMLPSHWATRARYLRGEILLALGRDDEAADTYDSIFSAFDVAYFALAHLRRAQIHARHREIERARFHYGRFLSLWKDCDPEFRPLVEQARRALTALRTATPAGR